VLGIGGVAGLPVPGNDPPASDGAGGAGTDVPSVASELRKPLPHPEGCGGIPSLASDRNKPPSPIDPGGDDAPSVASELRKPPRGSAGMGGVCADDHDGGSTPKVGGREPGGSAAAMRESAEPWKRRYSCNTAQRSATSIQ